MKIDSASSKMSTGCHNKQMDLSGKGGHSMEVISKKIGTPPGMLKDLRLYRLACRKSALIYTMDRSPTFL